MLTDKAHTEMAMIDHPSLLDEIDARYRRAASCQVRKLILDHPLISEIARQSAQIFSLLDRGDDHQKRLARGLWLLKSTIMQTLLPFDDIRIDIMSMANALKVGAESVPSAADSVNALVCLVTSLVASSTNPKREIFLKTLPAARNEGGIAIYAGLQGSLTPGWPIKVSASTDFPTGSCTIFRTRKDIAGKGFGKIVIPGTLRFSPRATAMDLLHGGRASEVTILAYKREGVFAPDPIALPVDHRFTAVERTSAEQASSADEGAGQQLDQWANESFWQEVRAQYVLTDPLCERDITVAARFTLFADGSGAFLPEDGSVVEISALLDHPERTSMENDRLPRKAVRYLEERDLVMLRLSGSGDYLDEVADRLMEREGLPSLREDSTAWKLVLFRAIKRHGEGTVSRAARDEGMKLRSATYLWNWASDAVIAPHDFDTFRALIRALNQLEGDFVCSNPDEYAQKRWAEMDRLKVFHQRAAAEIRKLLLERVRTLVAARQHIESVESIHLPGLEAGCIGLLRVSAVDETAVRIPYSRLFHLVPVKVA